MRGRLRGARRPGEEKIPGTAECQMAMVLIQAQNILFQPGSNFLIHSANQYS